MFNPLQIRTDYTFLESTIRIDKLCKRLVKYGYKAAAITDRNNLYGSVKFFKKCKELNIKPILGCSIDINSNQGSVFLLVKNLQGWKALIKIVSEHSIKDISLEYIAEISKGNLIVYGGGLGSHLVKSAFKDYKSAIKNNYNNECFYENASEIIEKNINTYYSLFKDDFYISLEKFENENNLITTTLYNILKTIQTPAKKFANISPYYLDSEDSEDQRILLCSKEQVTLENVQKKIELSEDYDLLRFFKNSKYYMYTQEEIEKLHDKQEVDIVDEIVGKIEDYDILSLPKIPNFKCPDGYNNETYLKKLCEKGWDEKLSKLTDEEKTQYYKRLTEELETFLPIGLAPYFLIIWDIMNWSQSQGWICTSRGSAGGCLISYLLNITESDPVKYNLLFTRFFNIFRDQPEHVNFQELEFNKFK